MCITYRMGRDVEARWTIELRGAPSANLTPRQGRVSKGGNKKIHAGPKPLKNISKSAVEDARNDARSPNKSRVKGSQTVLSRGRV